MNIGVGGAGSKLSSLLNHGKSTIIDVSGSELQKIDADVKIRAVIHSSRAQLNGCRKDPTIGREAFLSIKDKFLNLVQGNIVFCSAGGGTGNGICSSLLDHLSTVDHIEIDDKTLFVFILPDAEKESSEFIDNAISFLESSVSRAIDAGNTGNIILFSNQLKFKKRIPEKKFNSMIIETLNQFLSIPEKNESLEQLDGNIDYEDFIMYKAKPYFNHFCQFSYDPENPFDAQLKSNYNKLLLDPEDTIEALFLLELPDSKMTSVFYNIIEFFNQEKVSPTYSVVLNPEIKNPLISVSILYSRKPLELVDTLNSVSGTHKRNRVKKSLDQYVTLTKLEVDMESEAEKVVTKNGTETNEVLSVLKRIGKL